MKSPHTYSYVNGRRRGFTLVEMMVVISVGSVLMTLALGLVHRTMRVESVAKVSANVERTVARLSQQLRYDAHRSQGLSIKQDDDDPAATAIVELTLPNSEVITYRQDTTGLIREEPLSDGKTYREHYALPEDHSVAFSQSEKPLRLVLTIERQTELVGVPPQLKLRVEAVVGLFRKEITRGGTSR